jgi:hypothetical protein
VQELFREAGYESQDGWKNLLSDITGLIAFIAILIFGRQQLAIPCELMLVVIFSA